MRQSPCIEDSIFNAGSSKPRTPSSTKVEKRRNQCKHSSKRPPDGGLILFPSIFLLTATLVVILLVSFHPRSPSIDVTILVTWSSIALAVVRLWRKGKFRLR